MKISKVLIDSHKSRNQIIGGLVNDFDEITGKPMNYCALGALACESACKVVREVNEYNKNSN